MSTQLTDQGTRHRPGYSLARCVHWLRLLAAGGLLLQTASGGCEAYLSSVVDALGQPVATGIGKGVSSLVEALVLNLFT